MNGQHRELVHHLVARQLRVEAASIHDEDRFDDIGLDPLDLVLIVMRLEQLDRGQGDFPLAALEHAETVGELVLLVDIWVQATTRSSAA